MSALAAIRNLPWAAPTKAIPVPPSLLAAAQEAGADLPAEFVVRMPTALDIAFVSETEDRARSAAAMIEAFAATGMEERVEALKAAAGLDGSTPKSFARQMEFLLRCIESPALDREDALWLNRMFPGFFTALFAAIFELSGEGASLGKQPCSTPTPPSEPL